MTTRNSRTHKIDMRTSELFKAYEYGVNYGLHLAELERMSEEGYDAALCGAYSRKTSRPSPRAPRRQARSMEWQEAMGAGQMQFLKLLMEAEN